MKKVLCFALLMAMCAGSAWAWQSRTTYDRRSGNTYHTTTDGWGNTCVQGSNSRTGSTWTQRIDRQGNMSGINSGGNAWNGQVRQKKWGQWQ